MDFQKISFETDGPDLHPTDWGCFCFFLMQYRKRNDKYIQVFQIQQGLDARKCYLVKGHWYILQITAFNPM